LITYNDFFNYTLNSASKNPVTVGAVFQLVLILSITVLISKIVSLYIRRSLKDKVSKDVGETIIKLFYYGTIIIVSISALHLMGIDLSGLLLAGGITGIILGFASQNIVGNLISGIFLMIEKPIKIGDQVEISGTSGFITDIRIISTHIRTYDGLLVRIPNQQVFTSNITNVVGFPVRRFDFTIGIRYSDNADHAIELIMDLLDKEPFALLNPEPSVKVNNLGESSVVLIVRVWAPISEWFELKSNLVLKVKKNLEENGIEIPFPQQVVYLHNVTEKNQIPEKAKYDQNKEIESVLNYEERVLA
jgi:small-conductance mechanosensitive channel